MGEKVLSFIDSQPALVTLIVLIKELSDILHSLTTPRLTCPSNATLIVVEDDGEEDVHEEKNSKGDEEAEEESVPGGSVVGRQHDVREVRSSDEDDELEVSVFKGIEFAELLEGTFNDEKSDSRKVSNIEKNAS